MDWGKLKKFKNQLNLARKASSKMSQKNLNLNFKYDEGKGIRVKLDLPPEPEIARFATVLKPLADPNNELYFNKIISIIAPTLSPKEHDSLEKAVKSVDSGPINLIINDKRYSALDLYLIYSKGEFFEEDKEALEQLKILNENPLMPNFVLHQFYNYSFDVYNLCKYLYRVIRNLESNPEIAEPKTVQANNKCIYCLTGDGSFTSQEHVYPESLGNDKIILPPGHVCDKCNNEKLSGLDNELVESDMISYLRFQFVPFNPKTGEFPKVKYQNATMEKTHPRKIVIKATDARSKKKFFHDKKEGDQVHINFQLKGRKKFDHQQLGRALYKIALGIVCWQHGSEKALDDKYDPARDFILGKSDFRNYLLFPKKCTVSSSVKGEFIYREPGTFFTINIFGAAFFFNLEPDPKFIMNEQMKEAGLQCLSLADNYKNDPVSQKQFEISFDFPL